MSNTNEFGPIIFSYSRAQAIADGVLIDVSKTASEAGWKWNTCVTSAVWAMIEPSEEVKVRFGCDTDGRLWDVVYMAMMKARRSNGSSEFEFQLIMPQTPRDAWDGVVTLRAHCGPGDTAEPVVTIMRTDED
jgi:hypothetical protein